MSGITKCDGEGCGMRYNCYRFRAEPSDWQSYFKAPVQDGECQHFRPHHVCELYEDAMGICSECKRGEK